MMIISAFHRLILPLALILASVAPGLADREVIPLDKDWRFIKQNVDLLTPVSSWDIVSVPHTWNALDAQGGPPQISDKRESEADAKAQTAARVEARKAETNNGTNVSGEFLSSKSYYRGACWYARQLNIPAEWEGQKRVFVRVEAAGTVAKTYINKTLLGEHRGGFTAFCYELTDYLKYGGENELRIQVDNTPREDLPPLSGDFNLDGGLYRPVQLIVTDEICISPLDYASSGIYLTTKSLDDKEAAVEVRSIISNGNQAVKFMRGADKTPGAGRAAEQAKEAKGPTFSDVTVQTEIKDASGGVVATESSLNRIPDELSVPVTQIVKIPNPHLWNGRSDPYLYTATVSLLRDGKCVDQVSQPLGLRSVAITQDRGFLLNGKPYPIHGVCRHQDVRNKGWAISPEDEEGDAAIMKEMGVTAVRNAHYPQSEHWHQINDREGVLLWNEISLVNETRSSRAFWSNSEDYLREMIHQLYNHPSIMCWGIFNELGNRYMPQSDNELKHLQEVAKELDPNRFVVSATCHEHRSFNQITEQIGFNHYPGWYTPLPPSSMAKSIDSDSAEVDKRVAISEYGAGANIAHHVEGQPVHPEARGAFHPEEYQSFAHEQDWAVIKNNPHLWGSFVWNMFDFACTGREEGNIPSLNDKGLVTHDRRFKKDAFFFYKANWNPEPMVYITSRRATPRTQPVTEVKVYSNCPLVELKVNGAPLGSMKPDDNHITRWPSVTLQPGTNTIEATGVSNGQPLSDSCTWTLDQAPKS